MEVTRDNFNEVLPLVVQSINESNFIAIDGEFTGLRSTKRVNSFDHPSERYQKVREDCSEFLLIQMGLCCFRYDLCLSKFVHEAYDFYIFPNGDGSFLSQASSLGFLASNGFDFNKLFKSGIPYMNKIEESERKEYIETWSQSGDTNYEGSDIGIPQQWKSYVSSICDKIDKFLLSDNDSLKLEKSNAFVRKLIYQTARKKYSNIFLELSGEKNDKVIVVHKGSEADRALFRKKQCELKWKSLDEDVGFSKVISAITDSRKLVVGHNMLLDICHVMKCFHKPLPVEYKDFKEELQQLFSCVLDTKTMASLAPFKDVINFTDLSKLHDQLNEQPFSIPDIDIVPGKMGYQVGCESQFHKASYDSFITGCCFLGMYSYLAKRKGIAGVDLELIKPYINKIFMSQSIDMNLFNIGGEDVIPDRQHVFYMTFPANWKPENIFRLFRPFGNVTIGWCSDTSALVALHAKQEAGRVLRQIEKAATYEIISYKQYQENTAKREDEFPQSKKRKARLSD